MSVRDEADEIANAYTLSSPARCELASRIRALVDPLKAEVEEYATLNARLSDILARTANALKGEPEPLRLHGWADLPDTAARLTAENARLAVDLHDTCDELDRANVDADRAERVADQLRAENAGLHAMLCHARLDERRKLAEEIVRPLVERLSRVTIYGASDAVREAQDKATRWLTSLGEPPAPEGE